jgi:hypothetical protein
MHGALAFDDAAQDLCPVGPVLQRLIQAGHSFRLPPQAAANFFSSVTSSTVRHLGASWLVRALGPWGHQSELTMQLLNFTVVTYFVHW